MSRKKNNMGKAFTWLKKTYNENFGKDIVKGKIGRASCRERVLRLV